MKISVFGSGYVGLVTGVCFADMGNDLICADIDQRKVDLLKDGKSPIYEPGLDALLKSNLQSKRLSFTSDLKAAVQASDLLFIAVGTPSDIDGSADLKYVLEVARTIGNLMECHKTIVTKSTVPVGTFGKIKNVITDCLVQRKVQFGFDLVSNPEFLREGMAIEDCLKPNRVVIGCESEMAEKKMRELYEPFLKSGNPIFVMDPPSAEMTKYAANAMLATRISFMNEVSQLCEKMGANIENVRRGIGSDHRIGPHFIFAGVGYGGSCFPKDVKALIKTAKDEGLSFPILNAVEEINRTQRDIFFQKIEDELKRLKIDWKDARISQWGLAFKPGTDDIREAPGVDLLGRLLSRGARVQAFDPVAADNVRAEMTAKDKVDFFDDQYAALENADILVIVTEWKSFREPDFERIKKLLKNPVVIDGRNIYSPERMRLAGFSYNSIGRPEVRTDK